VARTIEKKADQHIVHAERAILAVDAMFDDADDLREAFDRKAVATAISLASDAEDTVR
jgi:hypothetical protein